MDGKRVQELIDFAWEALEQAVYEHWLPMRGLDGRPCSPGVAGKGLTAGEVADILKYVSKLKPPKQRSVPLPEDFQAKGP